MRLQILLFSTQANGVYSCVCVCVFVLCYVVCVLYLVLLDLYERPRRYQLAATCAIHRSILIIVWTEAETPV
jgi:hypothetical protein